MFQDTYYVPKRTGTYSDVLVAYGLAALVDRIFHYAKGPVTRRHISLEDIGSHYVVQLDEPIRQDWVEKCPFFELLPFIHRQDFTAPDDATNVRSWSEERAKFFAYLALTQEERDAGMVDPPNPDHRTLEFLGNMKIQIVNPTKSGFQSYNGIFSIFRGMTLLPKR